MKEREKRRKQRKRITRNRFWSIFQKAKASTFFRERHVTGSENAAARFWRAAVCWSLEGKDGEKENEKRNERRHKRGVGEKGRPGVAR